MVLVTYDDDSKYVCKTAERAYDIIKSEIMGMDIDDLVDDIYDDENPEERRQGMLGELEESYEEYKRNGYGEVFSVCEFCYCEEVEEME